MTSLNNILNYMTEFFQALLMSNRITNKIF